MSTHLEIISSSGQELVSYMERPRALNAPKILLAGPYTPRFVADIDKDVIAPVERAERQARPHRRSLDGILHDEHGLFQLLAGDLTPVEWVDADGAVLAEDRDGEVEVRRAGAQGRLGDVEELGDVSVVPGDHLGEQPFVAGHVGEAMGGGGVVAEEEVTLAAHDDKAVAEGGSQVGGSVHGVEETLQALVVLLGVGVAGGGDDADLAALGEEAEDAGDDGAVGGETGAVVVEGDVAVEGDQVEAGVALEAE